MCVQLIYIQLYAVTKYASSVCNIMHRFKVQHRKRVILVQCLWEALNKATKVTITDL